MNKVGYQAGPAGLVACAKASPGIAVKVFEEKQIVPPVGIFLKFLRLIVDRPATVAVALK